MYMTIKDRLSFRQQQAVFFQGMIRYPNDKDRMEAGIAVLEKFIESLIEREVNRFVGGNSTLQMDGQLKGGKKNDKQN